MIRLNKIAVVALLGAVAIGFWQLREHAGQARRLAWLEQQLRSKSLELEAGRQTLAVLQQEAAGLQQSAQTNATMRSLLHERAATTAAAAAARDAAREEQNRAFRSTLANTLDNPEQMEINRALLTGDFRSRSGPLVEKLGLTAEQTDQLFTLITDNELAKTSRLAALLRGQMNVADALEQRDAGNRELQNRIRSLLGDDGYAVYDDARQQALDAEAERNLQRINGKLGDLTLDEPQQQLWRAAIRAEISDLTIDDTDLFRNDADWTRFIAGIQQDIFERVKDHMSPEQIRVLEKLRDQDLADMREQHASRRRAYGLPPD